MFSFGKNKKPAPKWFKWGMLGLIALALLNGLFGTRPNQPMAGNSYQARALPTLEHYPTLQQTLDGEQWKRRLDPSRLNSVSYEVIVQGSGDAALCGQEVTLSRDGESLQMRLGDAEQPQGLQQAVTGMRVGEERHAKIPQHLLQIPTGEPTLELAEYRLVATALMPSVAAGGVAFARTVSGEAEEGSTPAQCGDTLSVQWAMADATGQFGGAQPLTFTLGEAAVPHGFTRALLGLRAGQQATATLPPAYAEMPERTETWQKAFDGEQIVIVRLSRTR